MDDGTFLLYRLPVGSGGHRENRRVHFSFSGFTRTISNRGPACVLAAPRDRTRVDCVADCVELSRHRLERHFSELDHVWHACAVCCLRGCRSEQRVGGKFASVFYSRRVFFLFCCPFGCFFFYYKVPNRRGRGGGGQA